ncbi:class I SAM-dependent methyltransferase [Actinophytocola sp.]|uniref:class I SAM-dependent methyltransferase n=1 Tax=Actinophytocola sp. TaxID=1872138 RepID=UPI002D2976F2|nr:class I SAM-dependent methyltransferase [Actinophytocola sp.]HYQ66481.1 class I SAM-dependent methyltransferase [Actinophytocola sp.]
MRLIDDDRLTGSWVVANRDMNRGRGLSGRDGYSRVLGVDLRARLAVPGTHWLDLCCGEGRALREAAGSLPARLTGVDLVGPATPVPGVRFVTAPVGGWTPEERFDLITCVHGLHYVGDKLGLLARIASWLTADGLFVANFDAGTVRFPDGDPGGRRVTTALRAAGFSYDGRTHRVSRRGPGAVEFAFHYLGADDRAGPNYTGQPAVHSYYRQ